MKQVALEPINFFPSHSSCPRDMVPSGLWMGTKGMFRCDYWRLCKLMFENCQAISLGSGDFKSYLCTFCFELWCAFFHCPRPYRGRWFTALLFSTHQWIKTIFYLSEICSFEIIPEFGICTIFVWEEAHCKLLLLYRFSKNLWCKKIIPPYLIIQCKAKVVNRLCREMSAPAPSYWSEIYVCLIPYMLPGRFPLNITKSCN